MQRLSIDEVIEHCNRTCEMTEKIAKARGHELESIESKQFWEHYQVREWLEELKQYRAIGLTPELIEAMQGHNVALINDLGGYQAIGTIEEFKALKEKSVPKKVVIEHIPKTSWTKEVSRYLCPSCRSIFSFGGKPYCSNCGQKLDWE